MTLQTPYTQMVSIISAISIPLGIYIWRRFRMPEGAIGMLLILASTEWMVVSVFQLASSDLSVKLFWNSIKYVGMVIMPPAWLIFTAYYTAHGNWITHRNVAFLSVLPVLTLLLAFTNEYHGLIWSSTVLREEESVLVLQHVYGRWFQINMVYTYVLIFLSSLLLLQMLFQYRSLFWWQSAVLLTGALLPPLWSMLYVAGLNLYPHLEPTPLNLPVTNLAIIFILLYVRTETIMPVAREAIFEGMSDGVIVLDSENRIVDMNASAQQLMEHAHDEFIGQPIEAVWPGWSEHFDFDGWSKAGKEMVVQHEGEEYTYDLRVSALTGWHDQVISRIIVIRDITERKEVENALKESEKKHRLLAEERRKAEEKVKASLKEKEVLLREIHHRVKNNLQIICSLLSLQARYIKDGRDTEMLKESQDRIRSMALTHEKLYQSENLANIDSREYITDLVYSLFQSYDMTEEITLTMDVEDVSLGIDAAVPCGLIINELVSNALKYAFPDRKGEMTVLFHAVGGVYELVVKDDGVGMPEDIDFRNTNTLGLRLVTLLAEGQLDGRVRLFRNGGTEFHITFRETG